MKWYTAIAWALLTTVKMVAQEVVRTMLRLPDTGQYTDHTGTFGEDSDVLINAPFFIVHGDGTVTDTITGLMWQQMDGGEMTITAAGAYVDTLSLGGHTDWRLPDAHEAFSILDQGAGNPALDPDVFITTDAEYWWTRDRQIIDTNKVWVTNAGGGIGDHPRNETISAGGIKRFHVRAVRTTTTPVVLPSRYTDVTFTTATDARTGLVWQRYAAPDSISWEDALHYADTLTIGGQTDWRLPNIKELRSLNDELLFAPSVDSDVFFPAESRHYWSSTTLENQPTKAWHHYTRSGITTYSEKTARADVRCVRGGVEFVTEIVTKQVPTNYAIHPVPAHDRIRLSVNGPMGLVPDLMITDLSGRAICALFAQSDGSTLSIDLTGIPPGLYQLVIVPGTVERSPAMIPLLIE